MARIVLVEDDETIGGHLAAALRGAGHDSEWCPDGASALARAVRGPADLVLLDLGLPDADGFELCRQDARRPRGGIAPQAGRPGAHHPEKTAKGAKAVVKRAKGAKAVKRAKGPAPVTAKSAKSTVKRRG
ncbi:response regulator transcription factor [Streptomyces chattanoogensis]|uniref:response regulator transcription factor n=1 Tax=Streptomyces chattanoogensis TaxID=66876 RepID=UPI00099C2636|nr:response regulator [Streptomyces chattanoogensis]